MLPASPVSRGCRILLARTCCKRSESRVLSLPRLRMRDFRRFSLDGGGEICLTEDEVGLRLEPIPRSRKILRLRPPSGRRGMRVDSLLAAEKKGVR
jgi:hypothetical protein